MSPFGYDKAHDVRSQWKPAAIDYSFPSERAPNDARAVRISYTGGIRLRDSDALVVPRRGGGVRVIPPGMWWISRNTPVGEDADLYERKPYNGRRLIPWDSILAVDRTF